MFGRIALKLLAPRIAKRATSHLIGRILPSGQHLHGWHGIQRALRVHIECLDRLNRIIKQIHAVGQRRTHWKQIHQTAAQSELARRDHLADIAITRVDQLLAQRIHIQTIILLE